MKKLIAFLMTFVCVFCAAGCGNDDDSSPASVSISANALALAQYPAQIAFPEMEDYTGSDGMVDYDAYDKAFSTYNQQALTRRDALNEYSGELDGFFSRSILQFLCNADEENRVYSPVNVYLALALLAEVTDGESRGQILNLLGTENIKALRKQAASIWTALYQDDGAVKCLLANSIWLRDGLNYKEDSLKNLASYYYASAFSGEMGAEEFSQALRDWINQQTGGLLKEAADGLSFNPETVCALASTLYFKAKWDDQFEKSATRQAVFHGTFEDTTVDFMNSANNNNYWFGEKFTAVRMSFSNSDCGMWFFLPNENVSVDEMINDPEMQSFLLSSDKYSWEKTGFAQINMSVPKFDVSGDINLSEGLQQMGITDVFDPDASDFTPLTEEVDNIYVSSVTHAARVKIDEEGCEAAAFTVIMAEGTALPNDSIDFILDRPFFFAVTGTGELPLFTGVVNTP